MMRKIQPKLMHVSTLANCSTDPVVRTNILDKGLMSSNLLAPLQARY